MTGKNETVRSNKRPSDDSFWDALIQQVKLVWRLLKDRRIPLWTKAIPFLSLVYLFIPADFVPDIFAGLGQLDDIAIIALGMKLFLELTPPNIVNEHVEVLAASRYGWTVIEGDSEVVEENGDPQDDVQQLTI